MDNNIVIAPFARDKSITRPVHQYDYGLMLNIIGGNLPDAFEIHFSNALRGEAKTQIVQDRMVPIPDEYLLSGEKVYAWIFLHQGQDDGETVFVIEIPVIKRAKPTDEQPTPVEQSAITQAIAALQTAVTESEASASASFASANNAREYAEDAAASLTAILGVGVVATDDGAGNITISLGGA